MPLTRRRLLTAAVAAALSPVPAGCRRSGPAPIGAPDRRADPAKIDPAKIDPAKIDERIEGFLAEPDANGAALLAIAMADTGDIGWVPAVLDLLQLLGDDLAADQVMVSLQRLTGRYVLDDLRLAQARYGTWLLEHRPVPVPGYERFKIAVYSLMDPSFGPLLGGVGDPQVLAEIVRDGTVPGGVPVLDRPVRSARDAGAAVLGDDELVFGVELGGVAVAYPERVLGRHVVAVDTVAGVDIAVTYDRWCRSARAMLTEGRAIRPSGLLRGSNTLLAVDGTTLWQQLDGAALGRAGGGRAASAVPVRTTTWSAWRERYPTTEVVATPAASIATAGETGTPYRYDPGAASVGYDADGELWFPAVAPPVGPPPKTTVACLAGEGGALAVDTATLARRGPVTIDRPGARPARVLAVPCPEGARLYDASRSTGPAGPVVVGAADLRQAVLGDGSVAPALEADRMTWFAWCRLHPASAWWPLR